MTVSTVFPAIILSIAILIAPAVAADVVRLSEPVEVTDAAEVFGAPLNAEDPYVWRTCRSDRQRRGAMRTHMIFKYMGDAPVVSRRVPGSPAKLYSTQLAYTYTDDIFNRSAWSRPHQLCRRSCLQWKVFTLDHWTRTMR